MVDVDMPCTSSTAPVYDRDNMYGFGDDERGYLLLAAVLEMLGRWTFGPMSSHLHDWQGGLVPNMLDAHGDGRCPTSPRTDHSQHVGQGVMGSAH